MTAGRLERPAVQYDTPTRWWSSKDLIDDAYLENRTGGTGDSSHATRGEDRVVDCKTVIYSDPTDL
ncbi:MAG TPA: hypothetical protein VK869_03835 [Rubrobacteraceae bacterium]|nr:hypothetical protein [Rubrobacteraceae bacterium]